METRFLDQQRIHFELSLQMVEDQVLRSPDPVWDDRVGGFVYWQQLLHTLTGLLFWTRPAPGPFSEPFADREVYPELDGEPRGTVSRAELADLLAAVRSQWEALVAGKDDRWLLEPNGLHPPFSNFDVVAMLTRHNQYHVGHCDAGLRERGHPTSPWLEYQGNAAAG